MSERRYTRNVARFVFAARCAVVVVTLPFLLAVRAVGSDEILDRFRGRPIRLVDGEFYP